jgi:hypothetical protein
MQVTDVLALALILGGAGAFAAGEGALARADDLRALYWLAVGAVSLWAAVRIGRPAAKA